MKKQVLIVAFLISGLAASAQKEYKVAKSSGTLNLNLSGVKLVGYSGNEVIFSAPNKEAEKVDDRAQGLRVMSGSGFSDNSGLGLEITVKGEDIQVNPVSRSMDDEIMIKVPQDMKILVKNNNSTSQNSISISNMKNEIEVGTGYNNVKLENNTGPMNVKSIYGSVDVVFPNEIKGPVSIVSMYGHVDVAVPASVKANLSMGTNYGKLYAAESLKIARTEEAAKPAASTVTIDQSGLVNGKGVVVTGYGFSSMNAAKAKLNLSGQNTVTNFSIASAESIKGTINGGGTDLILKSNYDNIYLRVK